MAKVFGNAYNKDTDLLNADNTLMPIWAGKTNEATEIPLTSDDHTAVTIEKMFPLEYSMDPIAGGKFILLQEFNGIFKTLTTQLRNQLMYSGILVYNEKEAQDRGGYPLDALISVLYDQFTGTLCTPETLLALDKIPDVSDTERRAKAQRLLVRSLIPNNTDSPLVRRNLFKTWEIMDGVQFGEVKEFMIMHSNGTFPAPPGYLDIGSTTNEYDLELFPRVAIALKGSGGVCGHIRQKGSKKFTITDTRGLFSRVFNNAITDQDPDVRDPGRSFADVQDDAMGVITGAVMLASAYGEDDVKWGDPTQKIRTVKGFCPVVSLPQEYQNKKEYAFLKNIENQNCFRVLDINTNYELAKAETDRSFLDYGIYPTSIGIESTKAVTSNALVIDTSDHPKSAHEVRPKNYCVKKYIKV